MLAKTKPISANVRSCFCALPSIAAKADIINDNKNNFLDTVLKFNASNYFENKAVTASFPATA